MHDKLYNKSAAYEISMWGFTEAEVRKLGLASLNKFREIYRVNLMDFDKKDMLWLYKDMTQNKDKYKVFVGWLKPRFDKFIELHLPMRIYVGGDKQFITRGDDALEKALGNVAKSLDEFMFDGKITPSRISAAFYYLNKMV